MGDGAPAARGATSCLLAVAFLLALALPAVAAPRLQMTLSPQYPALGEDLQLALVVEAQVGGDMSWVQRPAHPALAIDWDNASQSQQMQIVNGRTSVSTTFTWPGRAVAAGDFTLPAARLGLGGQVLESNPVSGRVSPRQASDFFLLRTRVTPAEACLGQSLTMVVDFLVADQEARRVEQAVGGPYELAQNQYEGLDLPAALQQDFVVTPVSVRQAQGRATFYGHPFGLEATGQVAYRVHRATFRLEPKRAGRLEVPAFTVFFFRLQAVRRADPFGFGMNMGVELRRAGGASPATSQPVVVTVGEVPKDGRPASWNGLVATALEAALEVPDLAPGQKVQMHAPIPVRVVLKSDARRELLQLPPWGAQPELLRDFEVSSNQPVQEDLEGGARFTEITFRPRNAKVAAVPPLEFSFYHPGEKAFKVVRTAAFPVAVEAVSAVQGAAGLPVEALAPAGERPRALVGNLDGLELGQELLALAAGASGLPALAGGLAALPWLLLAGAASVPALRRRLAARRERERFGLADTLRRLDKAGDTGERLRALEDFVAHRFGVKDPHDLRLADAELAAAFRSARERLEGASYGQAAAAGLPGAGELAGLLRRLDKAGP